MLTLELWDGPAEIPDPKQADLDIAALRRAVSIARSALVRADTAIFDGDDYEAAEAAVKILEGAATRVRDLLAKALPAEVMARLTSPRAPGSPADAGVFVAAGMALLAAVGCGGQLLPGSLPPSGFRPPCGGASAAGSSSSPTASS